MTAPALAQGVGEGGTTAPASIVRWLIVAVACAAALASFRLAFASDELSERGLQAALLNWITLPYILAGVIAWWRRPDSRFGPLMVGAGFAMFLSSLQWASAGVPYTVGLAIRPAARRAPRPPVPGLPERQAGGHTRASRGRGRRTRQR